MDSTTVTTAIVAGQKAFEAVKLIVTADSKLNEATLKVQLSDLSNMIMNLNYSLFDLKKELLAKDEEIEGLKKTLKSKSELEYTSPFFYMKTDKSKKQPFCPTCFSAKDLLIHVTPLTDTYWVCQNCKSNYSTDVSPAIGASLSRSNNNYDDIYEDFA